MKEQKCIITITGQEDEDTISYNIEFIPALDVINEKNNHQGIVQAGYQIIKILQDGAIDVEVKE